MHMKPIVFRSCHISMMHIEFDLDYNYFEKAKKKNSASSV